MNIKGILYFFYTEILSCLLIASIARWAIFEISSVPTGSMEKTIMPDNYVIISKVHYGPRIPMTPLQIPLTHQKTHLLKMKAFLDWIKLPYIRIPGFSKISRNDIVAFNNPEETFLPIDIRTFYIKRCLGLPGEEIKMINNKVYINNEEVKNCEKSIAQYEFVYDGILTDAFFKQEGITNHYNKNNYNEYIIELDETQKDNFYKSEDFPEMKLRSYKPTKNNLLIQAAKYRDTTNWGPIKIPYKGMKIKINKETLALYANTILNHDSIENKCEIKNDELYMDGKKINEYIFNQNYFFMIGDNRHNSVDSRYWGFVPENHIYGKCIFIFGTYILTILIILILFLLFFSDQIILLIMRKIKEIIINLKKSLSR